MTGCMAQRYKQEILEEIPEVDGILGHLHLRRDFQCVKAGSWAAKHVSAAFMTWMRCRRWMTQRMITTGGHYAFLKIAEGCDKHCTYCIIPSLRGNYRSVPMERLLKEAEELAQTRACGS